MKGLFVTKEMVLKSSGDTVTTVLEKLRLSGILFQFNDRKKCQIVSTHQITTQSHQQKLDIMSEGKKHSQAQQFKDSWGNTTKMNKAPMHQIDLLVCPYCLF